MGKPAARITDFHACPMVTPGTPPIPHVGGPIVKGSTNVFTGKLPQARVGDQCVCVGPPDVIAMGSTGVFVNKIPAARMGDQTAHGGVIVVGLPTVLIGESKGSGGGGAPGPMGMGVAEGGFVGGAVPNKSWAGFTPGAPVLMHADAKSLAEVKKAAAVAGTPFCEVCWRAAQSQAQAQSPALPKPPPQPFASAQVSPDPIMEVRQRAQATIQNDIQELGAILVAYQAGYGAALVTSGYFSLKGWVDIGTKARDGQYLDAARDVGFKLMPGLPFDEIPGLKGADPIPGTSQVSSMAAQAGVILGTYATEAVVKAELAAGEVIGSAAYDAYAAIKGMFGRKRK